MGASAAAFGEESVTGALNSVGFPHEGQNCFELSLHILVEISNVCKVQKAHAHLKQAWHLSTQVFTFCIRLPSVPTNVNPI